MRDINISKLILRVATIFERPSLYWRTRYPCRRSWANIRWSSGYTFSGVKTGKRGTIRLDELSSIVRPSSRTTEDGASFSIKTVNV